MFSKSRVNQLCVREELSSTPTKEFQRCELLNVLVFFNRNNRCSQVSPSCDSNCCAEKSHDPAPTNILNPILFHFTFYQPVALSIYTIKHDAFNDKGTHHTLIETNVSTPTGRQSPLQTLASILNELMFKKVQSLHNL